LQRGRHSGYDGRMRHPGLLDRQRTAVVVIDVQEAYRTVLHGWEEVSAACVRLVQGATLLGVPLLVTEQYPRGLGHTTPTIAAHLPADVAPIEKMTMSCCGAPSFTERLRATGRTQILVAGIEAHACVNQTVHDLLAAGYQVHVPRDATSSRRAADAVQGWEKMRAAGMLPTTSEQALLELVVSAEAPEFRALQRLLKGAS
jgi:nicotinamidase-related amidase